jgi:hypothetical protein
MNLKLILFIATITFFSCKKNRECVCKTTSMINGGITYQNHPIYKKTKKEANIECNGNEVSFPEYKKECNLQ